MFDPVFRDAQRDGRITFVYLRNWYLPACTEFENKVLHDADVVLATEPLYCAMLEFDYATSLAQRWALDASPAIVLVDPRGNVLSRLTPPISRERVIEAISRARATIEPAGPTTTAIEPARAAASP